MSQSRLFDILDAALELDPSVQAEFLSEVCGGDADLHGRVLALIEAAHRSDNFLRVETEASSPATIGPYRIVREIGRGASGVVYLAEDAQLRRPIALKTFAPGLSSSRRHRQRLREEALALASVTQANVAHVYSFEETSAPEVATDGATETAGVYITMEFVDGETLAERLRRGPLGLEEALQIGRHIAAGIEAAHRVGIVHRDLKPDNVRITPDGWVKVLDFGLALAIDEDPAPSIAAGMEGTPGYMSPEQVEGGDVDATTDLWAFGCLLFELVSGSRAIEGADLAQLLANTRAGEVVWSRLREARGRVRDKDSGRTLDRLEGVLRKCFHIEREARPHSVAEVRQVLDEELLRIRSAPFARSWVSAPSPTASGGTGAPGWLPAPRGPFIGREQTLRDLEDAWANSRLVNVTGPGGAGKTRTVLEFATRNRSAFANGAWFVELAQVSVGQPISEAIAQTLEIRDIPRGDLEGAVRERLAGQSALLVLDNCEHVSDEVAVVVQQLLDACPDVRILATSREPLRLSAEQLFVLGGMALPGQEAAARAGDNEAVRLFITRAAAHHPAFLLDDAKTELVAEICRRLDGLPLAIELAAAKTRALSLEELAARLERDSGFLKARRRGGLERHRSLDQLIDWSYRLLEEAERVVFRRLSVFRGEWSLAAAEAVCAWDSVASWDICDILAGLVEKSLVEADASGAQVRYRFLETVREFAARRWEQPSEAEASERARIEEQLVAYAIEEGEPRAGERGWTDSSWLARVQLDHANFRHAFEIALSRGRSDWAMALAVVLTRRAASLGYWTQGLDVADRALSICTGQGADDPHRVKSASSWNPADAPAAALRVEVLASGAQSAVVLDDTARADEWITEGLALAEQTGQPAVLAGIYSAAGVVAYYQARFDAADQLFETAERRYRELGRPAGLAAVLADRGRIRSVSRLHDTARQYYEEALPLYRRFGDRSGETRVLVNLGRTAHLQGAHGPAREFLEEALAAYRQDGDEHGMALCLTNLGDLAHAGENNPTVALAHYREAMRLRMRAGQRTALASILLSIVQVAVLVGCDSEAAKILAGIRAAYRSGPLVLYEATQSLMSGLEEQLEARLGTVPFQAASRIGDALSLPSLIEMVERDL